MNIANFQALVRHTVALADAHRQYIPILAWGESGVGKSECIRTVAEDLGIGFVDLRLGTQEVGDLIGLQEKRRDEVTGKTVTAHTPPAWFPAPGTRGLLFLDEINRGHLEVRQAVFQLLLDRKLHTHDLPEGWVIVSAVNPATENYAVDDLYDKAFLARFMHIAFEPHSAEWIDYAAKRDVDWAIRALIGEDSKFLGLGTVTLPQIRPTPRTWMMLAMALRNMPEQLEQEAAAGLVGPEAAAAWLATRSSPDRPVKAADVLANYATVKPTVLKFASPHNNRTDMLRITLDDLAVRTENKTMPVLTDHELQGLIAFLCDCPKDLAYAYLKFRFIRNKALRNRISDSDELYDFICEINKEAGLV